MTIEEFVATPTVLAVKVAVVPPAATMTEAGTVTFVVSELASVTVTPPVRALPVSVTVPVALAPATTEVGFRTTDATLAGLTVKGAVTATCCFTAEIVTGVAVATPRVVTGNVTEVAPTGTITEVGTVAAKAFELERKTGTPPVGAAAEIVTVPVEGFPPTTVTGASVRPVGTGAVAVMELATEDAPRVAVMTAPLSITTGSVEAVNVIEDEEDGTVTDAGTVATVVSEDERETSSPPAGAGPLRVTVPVVGCPPATVAGLRATDRTTGEAVRASGALFVAPP